MGNARESGRKAAPSTPLTDIEVRKAAEGLGAELKAMFDNVAAEPLPHEIVDLVDALEGRAKRRARKRTH